MRTLASATAQDVALMNPTAQAAALSAGQPVGAGRGKPGRQKAASKVRRATKNTAQRARKSRARKNRTFSK